MKRISGQMLTGNKNISLDLFRSVPSFFALAAEMTILFCFSERSFSNIKSTKRRNNWKYRKSQVPEQLRKDGGIGKNFAISLPPLQILNCRQCCSKTENS